MPLRRFVPPFLIALLLATATHACTCFPFTFEPDNYESIFLGRALDSSVGHLYADEPDFVTRFAVFAVWKGAVADTLHVRSDLSNSCGSTFSSGIDYLITANVGTAGGVPYVHECDHTSIADTAVERVISLGDPMYCAPGYVLPQLDEATVAAWFDEFGSDAWPGVLSRISNVSAAGRPLIPRLLAAANNSDAEGEAAILATILQIDPLDASFVSYTTQVLTSGKDDRVQILIRNLRVATFGRKPIPDSGKRRRPAIGDLSPGLVPALPTPEQMIRSPLPEMRTAALGALSPAVGACDSPWLATDDGGVELTGPRQAEVLNLALADTEHSIRQGAWIRLSVEALREPGWNRDVVTQNAVENADNPWSMLTLGRALRCGVDLDQVLDLGVALDAGLRHAVTMEDPGPAPETLRSALESGADLTDWMCSWCAGSLGSVPEWLAGICRRSSDPASCPD